MDRPCPPSAVGTVFTGVKFWWVSGTPTIRVDLWNNITGGNLATGSATAAAGSNTISFGTPYTTVSGDAGKFLALSLYNSASASYPVMNTGMDATSATGAQTPVNPAGPIWVKTGVLWVAPWACYNNVNAHAPNVTNEFFNAGSGTTQAILLAEPVIQ